MSLPLVQLWCERADDVVLQCDASFTQNEEDAEVILLQFIDLFTVLPSCLEAHFCLEDSDQAKAMAKSGSLEALLFKMSKSGDLSVVRDSSGMATATVLFQEPRIEQKFTNRNSVALAMAGAIILAALGVIAQSGELADAIN